MNRRLVLKALGSASSVALAGCLSDSAPTSDGTTSTSTTDSGFDRALDIADVSIPDDSQLETTVELVSDSEKSRPPTLQIAVTTNVDQEVEFGPYRPFGSPTAAARNGDAQLLLIPDPLDVDGGRYYVPADGSEEHFVPETPADGCWTATTTVEVINQVAVQVDLEAGDTIETSYRLLNSPGNPSCFPAGRYRAADTLRTSPSGDDDELTSHEWGFTIVVE
ncbi:hypothetical protein [Haloarchaeobius sp. HME9146]|uniref:hypothetical protein n=1 Tax=Haloarchaeobius sp. HME9146 TaxID=2978732 RepID=UPI0021BF709F|nr:hypothetical protein [Haloarchaeobius sp. HME9146]MCT9095406.1 hypothetical protein [Haloarchaeobius sp. HME9146]